MSLIETQDVMSEDVDEAGDNDNSKLVPVGESIRYRRRAQNAERKVQVLTEELAEARSDAARISEQLSNMQTEQKLMRKLAAAGVVDLETGVLITKARMGDEAKTDLDSLIEQLKREKRYLFEDGGRTVTAKKTAGAKGRIQNSQTILESAAKKAAGTGNRTDLQEYLKLRRNFL